MRGSAVNSNKSERSRVAENGLAGLGWLAGWAGLQRADLSSAESFRALRPRPAGLWGRSQQISFF